MFYRDFVNALLPCVKGNSAVLVVHPVALIHDFLKICKVMDILSNVLILSSNVLNYVV